MNRALLALALGLTMMGCAAGAEDPLPPEPTPTPERERPAQALSGELNDPTPASLVTAAASKTGSRPQAHLEEPVFDPSNNPYPEP